MTNTSKLALAGLAVLAVGALAASALSGSSDDQPEDGPGEDPGTDPGEAPDPVGESPNPPGGDPPRTNPPASPGIGGLDFSGGASNLGSIRLPDGFGGVAVVEPRNNLVIWSRKMNSNHYRTSVYEMDVYRQFPSTTGQSIHDNGSGTEYPMSMFSTKDGIDRALEWIENVYEAPAPDSNAGN